MDCSEGDEIDCSENDGICFALIWLVLKAKKVKAAPALHDEPLSLSLLFMHHKLLLSLVSLKHESESVVQLFLKVRQRELPLLCMMHQIFTFTFTFCSA